ncbi:MAG: hypothetical protein ABIJ97_03325 [Bacteroidota bacterium]
MKKQKEDKLIKNKDGTEEIILSDYVCGTNKLKMRRSVLEKRRDNLKKKIWKLINEFEEKYHCQIFLDIAPKDPEKIERRDFDLNLGIDLGYMRDDCPQAPIQL